MTTSATALLTRVRTWVLVAALTGLVIAVGALLGGAFLWLFVAIAVIFNLIGYFYSDRIALRAARAEPLSDHEAPQVHGAVAELAARAPTLQVSPVRAPMYIANPLSGAQTSALFSTHPPISERVRRLRAYDRVRSWARMPSAAPARGLT